MGPDLLAITSVTVDVSDSRVAKARKHHIGMVFAHAFLVVILER